MENLKPKIASNLELLKMEISHYAVIKEIEQKLLYNKSADVSRLYWDSWLKFKKLEMNGEGLVRINFAECCMNCYLIHRIYMSVDAAIELKLLPCKDCTNTWFANVSTYGSLPLKK